jgi:RHS repeat-associated protein
VEADFGYTGHFMLASQPSHTLTLYRLYRPDLGRWNSRDPLAEQAGLNLYAYVGNDPLNAIDPDGRFAFVLLGLGVLTVSAVALLWTKMDEYSQTSAAQNTADLQTLEKRHEKIPNYMVDLSDTAQNVAGTIGGTSATMTPPGIPESGAEVAGEWGLYWLEEFLDWDWDRKNKPKKCPPEGGGNHPAKTPFMHIGDNVPNPVNQLLPKNHAPVISPIISNVNANNFSAVNLK